jgi:hypothetical protein
MYLAIGGANQNAQKVQLDNPALEAFTTLKNCLITSLLLALADYSKPFVLEMDSSRKAMGLYYTTRMMRESSTQWPMEARL